MQSEKKITFLDRLRTMRETEFGAFLPVLFALAAIWGYFGFILPLHDLITCLSYTSPSPRDKRQSRMPSSA